MADKRELILDLLANDRTAQATRSAAKNLDTVAGAAADAGHQVEGLGKASTAAGQGTDRLGKAAQTNTRLVDSLGDEIASLQQDLVFLAQSFAETSDAADRLDISRAIRRAENDIRRLTKSRNLLVDALVPEDIPASMTASWGRKLVTGIASGVASSGGAVAAAAGSNVGMVIAGAAGATAAPILVSALSAAVSAGIGAGGIVAGVKLAAKDPVVAESGSRVGKQFKAGLEREAAQAFQGPLLGSLRQLETASTSATAKIGKAFDNLAPHIEPTVGKMIRAGDQILDSLVRASAGSGPALDALGDSILLLADGTSSLVDVLSSGGPEAAANLRLIAGATGDLITYQGNLLGSLSKLSNNPWITGPLLPLLRKRYNDAADSTTPLATKTGELARQMTNAERAANGERGALSNLSKELRAQADPAFALINAQNTLRSAQAAAAEATRRHGRNSEEARAATRKLAEAALDLQGRAGALSSTFNGRLTPAMRATFQAAGLTKRQIDDIEREFRAAKASGDRYAKRYSASATLNVTSASKSLDGFKKKINTIDGRTITVYTKITSKGEYIPGQGLIPREYGGPVTAGRAYLVGEKRPEVFVPDRDGRILPSVQAFSAASTRAAGGGAPAAAAPREVVLRMVWDTAPGADRALHEVMRRAIRIYGPL